MVPLRNLFFKIEKILVILYQVYQESRTLVKHTQRSIQKRSHKYQNLIVSNRLVIIIALWNEFQKTIAYLENLSYGDSQALKRAELKDQAKKWKKATYPMFMAIYLDIISPICKISVVMQSDFHDPAKVVKNLFYSQIKLQIRKVRS